MKITDCGAAKLLGAIFGKDVDLIKRRLGVPVVDRKCLQCGKQLPYQHKYFCTRKCWHDYTNITVECFECGELFKRSQSDITHQLNTPQGNGKAVQHLFCSRTCLGKFVGRNYGFKLGNKGFKTKDKGMI